ncbi:unc-112-related protein-like [Tachypleus tridentatus]|uniref:unc-112-related protein-like n=1 Tax=Tachypleus tridentatus TaxID=6853 RepID=UPI003FD2F588
MIADGHLVGDGSWDLKVYVTDLQVERAIRVKGDLHIGGVMLNLVEDVDVTLDWSDHALWWPAKNKWLLRTKSTLDQCGVQADALLHFTPMHKILRVQLPDLRFMDCKVDFSVKTFSSVVKLCKELGIRCPEELSFTRPLVLDHLKRNYRYIGCSPRQRNKEGQGSSVGSLSLNTSTPEKTAPDSPIMKTPGSGPVWNVSSYSSHNGSYIGTHSFLSDESVSSQELPLAQSPKTPTEEARQGLLYTKSLIERARLNAGWLDSSLSLMEQDVREFDTLQLKYKLFHFYDLNPKYDAVRINQIYEQARWSILTEEIDCTDEEMMMFAALQLQVNMQANVPQPDSQKGEDDVDAALTDLQVSLEGSMLSERNGDLTKVPELSDYLRYMKPKRFTLKGFKRCFFSFKDTSLAIYKNHEENRSVPSVIIELKGSEVSPDVSLAQEKYGIKLEVPSQKGMVDYWIRCDNEQQYAKWMAACRLASKGKTMADSSYDMEVKTILEFLSMQRPAPSPAISPSQVDINPDDYIALRFLRNWRDKEIVNRMLEAHANVKDLTLVDAKLHFIKAWQALPDFGISLFVVKFKGCKREDLLGIAHNRLMRMDLHTGDHIKTWRFNTMKVWNVNWEVKQVEVQFEEETIAFSCLTADCKVVHEFIGGYIFLSMRSKDQNQTLNEELFHKLTGGWV